MRLYAIHAPIGAAGEEVRAARTGFSLAALVFGPLWLLVRGLWLALLGYVLLAAAVFVLLHFGLIRPGAASALAALGNLYLAFEGRALALASWNRGGWPLVDLVHAQSALEAERISLERSVSPPALPRATGGGGDVIGVFPEGAR